MDITQILIKQGKAFLVSFLDSPFLCFILNENQFVVFAIWVSTKKPRTKLCSKYQRDLGAINGYASCTIFLKTFWRNTVWCFTETFRTHSLDPHFLKGGGENFDYLPRRGDSKKLKKGWKYGAGASQGGTDTFPIYFFQSLSFLHLEITLPFAKLCYAFEEKIFFSVTIILWEKVILSGLKMNLKIPHIN